MLTENDWLKLRDYNKQIALRVLAKLPGDWYLTLEETEGAVYDVFIKLLASYRPGAMSAVSFCWKYAEQMTVRNLLKEYMRLKKQFQVEDDIDGDDDQEQPRQCGKGDVGALSADDRQKRDAAMLVDEMLRKATPEDKEAMRLLMEGHKLEEIGERLGIGKSAVMKRLRKYGKEIKK